MNILSNYYFRLVCVDEQNPIQYSVLEDESIDNLDAVHDYVKKHFASHIPELTKWILIPIVKKDISIKDN